MSILPGIGAFGVSRGNAATTYTDYAFDDVNTNSRTFAAMAIGTAAADRYVLVGVVGWGHTSVDLTTIGGVAATLLAGDANVVQFYIAKVPTGTTADIVFSCAGAGDTSVSITVWSLTGFVAPTTVVDSDRQTTGSTTVNAPVGGAYFAVARNSAATTWTGATQKTDSAIAAAGYHSAASVDEAGEATKTISCTNNTKIQTIALR